MNINLWSFILSLCCIPLFFIVSFAKFPSFLTQIIGAHPLDIVLGITLIAFFLGVIGLKDVREWKAMARSVFTIIFTTCLLVLLVYIIFIGRLLS